MLDADAHAVSEALQARRAAFSRRDAHHNLPRRRQGPPTAFLPASPAALAEAWQKD